MALLAANLALHLLHVPHVTSAVLRA